MGVHKLRWQYLAHYWPPTHPLLIFLKEFLYWNKEKSTFCWHFQYHLPTSHLVNVVKECPLMGFETTFFSGFNQLSCKTTTNLLTFFRVKRSILVRQPKNIDEELHRVPFVFFTYWLNGRNICQVHYIPIMVLVIKLRTYHLLCLFTFIKKSFCTVFELVQHNLVT